MSEQTLKCPSCGFDMPLSTAIARQVEAGVETRFRSELAAREQTLRQAHEADLKRERARVQNEAEDRLKSQFSTELNDLRSQLVEKSGRLQTAEATELEMRRRQRTVEDRERALDLEVARRVDEDKQSLVATAEQRAAEALQDQLRGKDLQVEALGRQIQEMSRKLQQGSQQVQGEVAELALEEVLAEAFGDDTFEPVANGARGADLCQVVCDTARRPFARIVWESKNTKIWSSGWVLKVKEDQQALHGDVAVIVSRALPEGVTQFGLVDGVWVSSRGSAVALSAVLRQGLKEVAQARKASANQQERQELLYAYVTSPSFCRRVQGLAETLVELQQDVDRERRASAKALNKRETIIRRVALSVAAMYGDFQGHSGSALPELPVLQLPGDDAEAGLAPASLAQ